MPGLTQVFIACSLDGFIAGEDDDLSWLPGVGGDGQPEDAGDDARAHDPADAGDDARAHDPADAGDDARAHDPADAGDDARAHGPADAGDEPAAADDHGYGAFFAQVGALLMGRRTYDVVAGFDGWPYGDTPVLVATSRPIERPAAPTVRAVSGTPQELLAQAREQAGERNVYVDGGALIRSLLEERLIDEITVSIIPVILGRGIPLFAGAAARVPLELVEQRPGDGTLVQLRYRPLP